MNIQHYDRINRFEDTLQGSSFVLLSSTLVNGRTVRKYELNLWTNAALKQTVAIIRQLLARNPFLCPTFLLANAQEILREKPYLTINGEAVCLSEEKDTSDVPAQYIDRYFSQDILKSPIRCSRGHLLEGNSALLWFQTKRHCPGEGPPHAVEEHREQTIATRVLTDFRKARWAKLQDLNIFHVHLQNAYEIDLFAKLFHPTAEINIICKAPTKLQLLIDQQTIDIKTHVRRDAFALALRTKIYDLQTFTVLRTVLQDDPPLERVKDAFLLTSPATVAPLVLPLNSINPIRWIIDSCLGRVDKTIQTAIDAGNHALLGLILSAGAEVKMAIDHFAITYKDLLDYTVDQVSVEMKRAVNQLVSVVDHFASMTEQGLQYAFQQAQQIANTLPLRNMDNQLTTVNPRCFVVKDFSQKSIVAFKGNFPWIGKDIPAGYLFNGQSYDPKLRLNDVNCELFETGTQEVKFRFLHTVFKELPDKNKFMMASGIISFPYDDVGWIWPTTNKASEFHLTFLALPPIAGKVIAIFQRKTKIDTEKRVEKKCEMSGAGNQKSRPIPFNFPPDTGYEFDVKTMREELNGTGYYIDARNFKPNNLGITFCFDKPGWFNVSLTCDQVKTVQESQIKERVEEINLIWSEQSALQPIDKEELIRFNFEDCRGKKDSFSPPCFSKGILKISAVANGVFLLIAEIPQDLNAFLNET